ncbi:hypothetical protein QYE76_033596 [Lolium multiflorum]|uniref:Uncharacterized protein n=1 Tax=Lolium multiflorum TaxID=4521 RepID=A0AAD8QVR5_LOLMU|nr:hypothetical protein QYE76_033596 [Lolium multiflorum]
MEVNEDSGQLSSRKLCDVVGEVVMPWSTSDELETSQSCCCPRSLTPKLNSVVLGFWLVEYMLLQAIRNTHLVLRVYDVLMNAICLLETLLCAKIHVCAAARMDALSYVIWTFHFCVARQFSSMYISSAPQFTSFFF